LIALFTNPVATCLQECQLKMMRMAARTDEYCYMLMCLNQHRAAIAEWSN